MPDHQDSINSPAWITIHMAMELVSVSESTINRWIHPRNGEPPKVNSKLVVGRRLISRASLLGYVESCPS